MIRRNPTSIKLTAADVAIYDEHKKLMAAAAAANAKAKAAAAAAESSSSGAGSSSAAGPSSGSSAAGPSSGRSRPLSPASHNQINKTREQRIGIARNNR
ncbi:uncharacterized protein V1510DRAFT_402075 [Dipodascopsis tothii]|uniref:uncharacterized protein n=1 Tax=Dipodascopsis tothii TaxID=44089 RepID=UPI0034CE17A3